MILILPVIMNGAVWPAIWITCKLVTHRIVMNIFPGIQKLPGMCNNLSMKRSKEEFSFAVVHLIEGFCVSIKKVAKLLYYSLFQIQTSQVFKTWLVC